ncbi:gamma carbonic anhydrase family protein [Clostridium sp. MSJ-4]|uniref:Gamma carbonic anhydrase family protein n=1 Tax=Clostridium simiarum TaxID=2841506 RepID=A0ABS6EWZ6_9CLOT|nr:MULTISPECIES: gamma carbonic anhydrase family protein [Clostridium]MBU5590523.1 gamma carbonic anhydrase family protein [Clostridium simiarum]
MIIGFDGKTPNIHKEVFIASSADIIGDVTLEKDVNIWFGAVLRGDGMPIYVGEGTNIQDNCVVHIHNEKFDAYIGKNVTVGHSAIVHACRVGDNCLIGMGAIILDGAEIGENTIIAAGSLVPPGKVIPSGVLCMGSPVKVIRELTEKEKQELIVSAKNYIELSKKYK